MSMTGLCQICEQKEAEHSCPNCGSFACETHWDDVNGLCSQCARTIGRGTDGKTRPENVDDVMRF